MTDAGAHAGPIRAAGALLWRDGPDGPEFAVAHRPRYDDWSFPKGKLDRGEHMLRAAVREIEEETGLVPRLGRRLPTAKYRHGERPKRVDYWAARPVAEAAFTPNEEVDELAWLPAAEAGARLSYPHDADLLRAFLDGPSRTWPLMIVRHGSAGEKHAWREPDELRPLDGHGRAEAAELAALLHAFGPARVLSSATARCLETVLPYARRIRADVVTDAAFTVGETGPDRARERLLDLLGDGVPTVVCTHGENVSELVAGLCRELGEKVPDDPSLHKGEFWVAHIGEGALAALERHTPKSR
ncbi:NUDIX domain-containing protein [Actinomadura nitritigenes]|uniref:NUDIX domain-containing protein n=1 Tax=Actinomadura nitritigenes TaxID=134602 RepID=UPI003D93CE66